MYNTGDINVLKYNSTHVIDFQEGKCYCLDEEDLPTGVTALSNRECNVKCPGDPSQICGGKGSISLFNFNYNGRGNYSPT